MTDKYMQKTPDLIIKENANKTLFLQIKLKIY